VNRGRCLLGGRHGPTNSVHGRSLPLRVDIGTESPSVHSVKMAAWMSGKDSAAMPANFCVPTTPGVIYQNLLILGDRVAEGPGPSAPGHIRAYDARTGQIVWTFHTIPYPGEPGYETGRRTPGNTSAARTAGRVWRWTNSAGWSSSHRLGCIRFWGGNRIGENLYANCLLALDAATAGAFGISSSIHHDLWDRDLPRHQSGHRPARGKKSMPLRR